MSSSKMTLIGQYNYDNTLFDGLTFPAGINKQSAVDEILLKSGEFEVLYSDIDFNKQAIEHWGKKNYRTFEKWIEALSIEFEPLYNFDRYEEYSDEKISQGNTKAASNTKDVSNSVSQTSTNSTSGDTNTRSVSAYDSGTYQPREQESVSSSSGVTGNGSASSDNTQNVESDSSSNNIENIKHTAHLYGNIGVTTSTELLEDFLRVERFNIYEQLADMFISELCILIY